MNQKLSGGALFFFALAPYGFAALELIGGYYEGIDPLFFLYSILFLNLGAGVYAGKIQFEQESAGKYEGLIYFFVIILLLMLVGTFFIIMASF